MGVKRKIFIIFIIFIAVITIRNIFSFWNNVLYANRLVVAIREDDINKVKKMLSEHGRNINSKVIRSDSFAKFAESNNPTPLFEACSSGNFEIIKLLVEAGADVNFIEPTRKWTPIGAALSYRNVDRIKIANYLMDNGADVTDEIASILVGYRNGSKETLKEQEEYDLFIRMINTGANLSPELGAGDNLLRLAAKTDNLLIVKYLVEEKNMDVNINTYYGLTPLMECYHIDIVKYLLEKGANKDAKNDIGETAYDRAVKFGKGEEIINILK